MTANQPPDPRFEAELKEWMERQEPRPATDAITDAVIARMSVMNQGRQPSFLLTLGTAAMAAVVAAMALSTGVLLERATPGGSAAPSGGMTQADRLPPGARVIQVGQPNVDLAFELSVHPDGVWITTAAATMGGPRSLVRVDPRAGAISGAIDHAVYVAIDGNDLWAMVSDDGRGPGVLTQVDPITGAALRTVPEVEGDTITIDGGVGWIPHPDALLRVDMDRGEVVERIEMPAPVWEDYPVLVAGGAVWVVSESGLLRVDRSIEPSTATVAFGQQVDSAVAGDGFIWARAADRDVVVQIDQRTSTVIREIPLPTSQAPTTWGNMTHGDGGVWVAVAGGLVRIDAATGEVGEVVPLPWGLYWGMQIVDGEMWVTVMDESELIHFPLPPG